MNAIGPYWCVQADQNDVWHAVLGDYAPPAGEGVQRSCDHTLLAGRNPELRYSDCLPCIVLKDQMTLFRHLGELNYDPVLALHLSGAEKETVDRVRGIELIMEEEDKLIVERMEEEVLNQ